MNKTVVYIAGPYRAKTEREVMLNIRRAESIALAVWQAGMVALCPHMNTAFFGGACDDATWLAGDLELLRRCDAVLLVPGWEESSGTIAEIEFARQHGIPVFRKSFQLGRWHAKRKAGQTS